MIVGLISELYQKVWRVKCRKICGGRVGCWKICRRVRFWKICRERVWFTQESRIRC